MLSKNSTLMIKNERSYLNGMAPGYSPLVLLESDAKGMRNSKANNDC
jgi:hypothetical protein